jgi:hypothetical protein
MSGTKAGTKRRKPKKYEREMTAMHRTVAALEAEFGAVTGSVIAEMASRLMRGRYAIGLRPPQIWLSNGSRIARTRKP